MARRVSHAAALLLLGLAVMLATPSALGGSGGLVAAYRRRVDADAAADYLAHLTAQDLRLMLSTRGVEPPEEADRDDLMALVKRMDAEEAAHGIAGSGHVPASAVVGHPVAVKVLYCTGWGYRNAFAELAHALRRAFGDAVSLEEGNYPAPAANQLIASAIQYGSYAVMLAYFVAPNVLPEALRQKLQGNAMMAFAGLFLAHNVANMLVQTGAFEVYVDGRTVFSRLETGEAPHIGKLVHLVGEQLRRNNNQQ